MFNSFGEKFRRFMYGRYGTDSLNNFMMVLLIALAAVNLFFRSTVIYVIQWVLLILILLRALSRNYYKRTKENGAFLKVYNPAKQKFRILKQRLRERKYRVYRKCPACHATIRLPKKKGKHGVKCPKCGNRFKVRILF